MDKDINETIKKQIVELPEKYTKILKVQLVRHLLSTLNLHHKSKRNGLAMLTEAYLKRLNRELCRCVNREEMDQVKDACWALLRSKRLPEFLFTSLSETLMTDTDGELEIHEG